MEGCYLRVKEVESTLKREDNAHPAMLCLVHEWVLVLHAHAHAWCNARRCVRTDCATTSGNTQSQSGARCPLADEATNFRSLPLSLSPSPSSGGVV